MKFTKVRYVKSPSRANKNDAGIDFFVPYDLTEDIILKKNERNNNKIRMIKDEILIDGHNAILIPSGLHVKFNKGSVLMLCNKSGVANNKAFDTCGNIIDADYQGEFHFHLINTTDQTQIITLGEKIIQGLILPVSLEQVEEIEILEKLYPTKSSRGEEGFGSSGIF